MKWECLGDHVREAFAGSVRSLGDRRDVTITPADMTGVGLTERFPHDSGAARQSPRERLRQGDILVSARGGVGKVALVDEAVAGALASANILVLRLRDSLKPQVLWSFLVSHSGRKALETATLISGVQRAISLESLLTVRVPIPALAVQYDIALAMENGLRCHKKALAAAELRLKMLNQAIEKILVKSAKEGVRDDGKA